MVDDAIRDDPQSHHSLVPGFFPFPAALVRHFPIELIPQLSVFPIPAVRIHG